MKVEEVAPNVETDVLLAGADFADAFRIALAGRTLDARQAAERMMGRSPRWMETLVALRNALVAPFGLKTSGTGESATGDAIGIFPVLSETPDRLVAGFDDSHLDFRVVVDVSACADGQQVTATTLVRTNNRFGRIYLAVILPFHRLVVRALLKQVAG
jgi:hypothetical protein